MIKAKRLAAPLIVSAAKRNKLSPEIINYLHSIELQRQAAFPARGFVLVNQAACRRTVNRFDSDVIGARRGVTVTVLHSGFKLLYIRLHN
jgi:hypothetical protein